MISLILNLLILYVVDLISMDSQRDRVGERGVCILSSAEIYFCKNKGEHWKLTKKNKIALAGGNGCLPPGTIDPPHSRTRRQRCRHAQEWHGRVEQHL